DFGGAAGDTEGGFTGREADDFDVGPGYAAAPAGADGFERGLLGGEARGESFVAASGGGRVGGFGWGEAAREEAVAVVGEELGDAGGGDDVGSVADDGHGRVVGARGGWRGVGARAGPRTADRGARRRRRGD